MPSDKGGKDCRFHASDLSLSNVCPSQLICAYSQIMWTEANLQSQIIWTENGDDLSSAVG